MNRLKTIGFLLKYPLILLLFLVISSCQSSNNHPLSHDEKAWLKNNEGKIEVLFGYQEPPNAFYNETGDYVGLLVDYQKEIEKQLNYKFTFRGFDTWEDLINYSKTAQDYIIIGCARTNNREEYLSFTNSIVKIPYVLLSQKNSSINSMSSLENKNVCTVSNYAVNDYLAQYHPNINPINFNSDLECIRAVSTGICDAMIVNQMFVTHIINNEGISNLKILEKVGYINRLAVAISKNDPILFQIIDKAIDNIQPNQHKKLYKSWVNADEAFISKKDLLSVLTILLIFVASFIVMWLWAISLKKQVARQTRVIKESEENLRITFNSIGDAIIVTDIDGKITGMNPVAEKLTGWNFEEIRMQALDKIFRIINSKTRETVEDPVKKVLKTGQTIGLANHTVLISKDGHEYQIADSGAPVKDEGGKILGVVLVFRDVTEEYKMREILKENEKRYRSLVENSHDGVFLFYNNTFEFVNRKFEQILEYSSKEMKEINFDSFVAPESLSLILSRLEEKDKSKLSSTFEFTGISKSGKKLPLEVSVSYIPYKNGIASQGIIRDISTTRQHEIELIKAKENAEESDRLKSVFLATMSHELRTPLNAVIGFSDLIQKDLPIDEILHFSEIIRMSGKHLLGVIEDVFDISLIEIGDIKIEMEPLNISIILDEVHEIIKNEQILQNKENIELILINKSVDQDSVLFSDQKRIKQILINLLKNALKFTNSGSIKFGYEVHEYEQKQFIQFFVKDTGIGIPQKLQKLIFEVFRQADQSHSRIYGGTGLGLTICKKLTNLMGGDIWVDSEEEKGSSFYFTIPLTNSSEKHNDTTHEHINLNLKNKIVLIAEDDETSFSLLDTLLTPEGIDCIWVKDGDEAVEFCENNKHIDLLLMDINMPKMNGYIATQKIKEIRPKLPIIAQTAFAIEGDKEKILAAGCDYYISKPINKNDLFEKILLCFESDNVTIES